MIIIHVYKEKKKEKEKKALIKYFSYINKIGNI